MTRRRVRGARGSLGLGLALLLGPALALAGAPSGGQDPWLAARPTEAPHQGTVAAPPAGSGSSASSVAGRVSVSAVTVQLELSQLVVRAGKSIQVRATLANESTVGVADVRLTIRADPSGITFRPAESRTVRRIAPGRTDTVSWSACGATVGTYAFVMTADVAGVLVTSRPQLLSITAGKAC